MPWRLVIVIVHAFEKRTMFVKVVELRRQLYVIGSLPSAATLSVIVLPSLAPNCNGVRGLVTSGGKVTVSVAASLRSVELPSLRSTREVPLAEDWALVIVKEAPVAPAIKLVSLKYH